MRVWGNGLDASETVTIFLTPEHTQLKDDLTMTRTEALAILADEAPCIHDAWEEDVSSDWSKCADCGEVFSRKDAPERKSRAVRFREALDFLAAEPTAPTPPSRGARPEAPAPGESARDFTLRVLQHYFPEAVMDATCGPKVDLGRAGEILLTWHRTRYTATWTPDTVEHRTCGPSAWHRWHADPGEALASLIRAVHKEMKARVPMIRRSLEITEETRDALNNLGQRITEMS